MSYKVELQNNNIDLQEILETINNLPEAQPPAPSGVSLNIAYGDTEPSETNKLWCKCAEPSSVMAKSKFDGAESISALDTVLPQGASGMGVGVVGKKVYLFGGHIVSDYSNKIRVFDTETGTITTLSATLPKACYEIASATIGTKVYLFGGFDDSGSCLNTINVYDTETDTITTHSTTLPKVFSYMASATIGTKVYLFGGRSRYGYSSTNYVFNTETGTITTLSGTLPTACTGSASAIVGTKVYLFGGFDDSGSYLNTINVYDTETEKITTLSATLPKTCSYIASATIGTKVYLFGGYNGSEYFNTICVFNTESEDVTTLTTQLLIACDHMGSATIGEKVYLFGGHNGSYSDRISEFNVQSNLTENTLLLQTSFSDNTFDIVDGIEMGVKNVYLGNSDNVGEKVEAYLHKDGVWTQI